MREEDLGDVLDYGEEDVTVDEEPRGAELHIEDENGGDRDGGKQEIETATGSSTDDRTVLKTDSFKKDNTRESNGAPTLPKSAALQPATPNSGGREGSLSMSADKLAKLSKSISRQMPNKSNSIVLGKSSVIPKPSHAKSPCIMLKQVPVNLLVESKVRSHMNRYGSIESVKIFEAESLIILRFNDPSSATRAFVNRTPVLKDQSIRVFRVPDLNFDEDLTTAIEQALECKHRVVIPHATPKPDSKDISVASTEASDHANGSVTQTLENADIDGQNSNDNKKEELFSGITINSTSQRSVKKQFSQEKQAVKTLPQNLKRSWVRAGVANLNDVSVIKAKQHEKVALLRVEAAKKEVESLIVELGKQKEQFSLIAKGNTASIGKNLRAELNSNINLLVAQLRSAQGSMASAKNGVLAARKAVELAIENSRISTNATTSN